MQEMKQLQQHLAALQQYTRALQEDFDYNLRLLTERDADIRQGESEREALQADKNRLELQIHSLKHQLAVRDTGRLLCAQFSPQTLTLIRMLEACS